MSDPITVCFLCTGNAARSVMARAMFDDRSSGYRAIGAGTLVIEGLPMSQRTRRALSAWGLNDPEHRSRQFGAEHEETDLVVAMEPSQVMWIRRHHPVVADRTASLSRLARYLPPVSAGDLCVRLKSMRLDEVKLEDWEEVVDPASGQQVDFDACAATLDRLIDLLIERLGSESVQ